MLGNLSLQLQKAVWLAVYCYQCHPQNAAISAYNTTHFIQDKSSCNH